MSPSMDEYGSSSAWFQMYTTPSEIDQASASQADQDQRNRGNRDSDEGEIRIEDFPTNYQGNLLGVQIVKPYAIEEPDDDSTFEPEGSSLPHDEEIQTCDTPVASREGLDCEPDHSNPQVVFRKRQNRGQKRKPTDAPRGQSCPSMSAHNAHYQGPRFSPNRRLRIGKLRIDSHGLSGSSESSMSTDTSDANLTSGSTTPDKMDID
ncbi:hypothetical protein BDW59DRAFT_155875 [Aspergillus cavernicola]|uniref:Uncharacterized protein n=1 Tax=Aspergillus cavernicola TaxID=176166 RepID=A0ABR4J5H5_9EURO